MKTQVGQTFQNIFKCIDFRDMDKERENENIHVLAPYPNTHAHMARAELGLTGRA